MQNFIIVCSNCRWKKVTTGISDDLKDLKEIPNNCSNCGKPRRFRCPRCGNAAKMIRVKGNS